MISYLGVTIDELVQSLESSFAFTDDREDRVLEETIYFEEGDEEELLTDDVELAATAEDSEDDEDFEDDELTEVFVDDEGLLHAYGQNVPFAVETALEFLTDYIVTDDIDEDWLTLDQARGAILALKVLLPTLEEIPEIECGYSFSITRDATSGLPSFVSMTALSLETPVTETLTHSATAYEGVVTDSTTLVDLFEAAGVPKEEFEVLADVLSESIFALSDEQCGIVIDAKAFTEALAKVSADPKRLTLVENPSTDPQH